MNFLQMFHQLLGQVRQVDERHLNVRWHLFVAQGSVGDIYGPHQ